MQFLIVFLAVARFSPLAIRTKKADRLSDVPINRGVLMSDRVFRSCPSFLVLAKLACSGFSGYDTRHTRSTQERRAARRELKTLAKTEAVSEEEQAKKLAELELKEQEELLHSQLSDTSQVSHIRVEDGSKEARSLPSALWAHRGTSNPPALCRDYSSHGSCFETCRRCSGNFICIVRRLWW